ncbi:MAG: peptidoglycan DD-metalloendopeptidase family protein [Chitinophagaceae bacterium]|jgi:septal ring factor EnvC (AmiA/AmiB activator)|nr:peptidoglycan DD-metalloendopeptidase family protein [Chitinophagaceae bacterium]
MIKKTLFLVFVMMGICLLTNAQTKEELQARQRDLQKELNDLNNTLADIKQNNRQYTRQLYLVEQKITARKNLINNINKQVISLDEKIYQNTLAIERYKKELDTLKANYAQSLVFAYKNRSNYNYLNFIFSSVSFNDAIKRVAYLKSYSQYRESQASNILRTQTLLENEIKELANTKSTKNETLQDQNKQLSNLEIDKKEKDQTVKELKRREGDIAKEISGKEKIRRQVGQALQAVIAREVAAAAKRAEAEKAAAARAAAERAAANNIARNNASSPNATPSKTTPAENSATPRPPSNRTYSVFESTPEGLTTSLNFEDKRGHLPWPVGSGTVIGEYGTHQLPGSKIIEHNDGIVIAVPEGTSVKCVASGEVSGVSDMGDGQYTVFVRHGKYFSVYSNLVSTNVSRNEKVNAGTVLGKAGKNLNGEGEITFMISNDKSAYFNPRSWLGGR